jgi:hypothetical protein
VGHPRRESGESEPGTHEVRAYAVSFGWQKSVGCIARLSHREVARPVGVWRALARKKSVAPPDAGRGWTEGEPVRVCGISKQSSHARSAGHELADSRYDGRRSRAHARLALTGRAKQGPLIRRSTPPLRFARTVKAWPAHRAVSDTDSGVPAGDDGNVRGRHVSVKALQGPRRSAESPHPRRSKWRRFSGAPNRERPKLTTANSFVDPPLP